MLSMASYIELSANDVRVCMDADKLTQYCHDGQGHRGRVSDTTQIQSASSGHKLEAYICTCIHTYRQPDIQTDTAWDMNVSA